MYCCCCCSVKCERVCISTAPQDELAGLNSEEEAEKNIKYGEKSSSRKTSSIPSANSAEQNCIQKHRLGTLLHSNRMEKKRCQDSSLPQRRKCVQFVQKRLKLMQNMYPLSSQTLHPGKRTSPEKSNFQYTTATPRRPYQ